MQSDTAAGQTRQGDYRLGQTGVLIYHLTFRQGRAGEEGRGGTRCRGVQAGWSGVRYSLSHNLITY